MKNSYALTHTKISPIYTRKNFPYIHAQKIPHIFHHIITSVLLNKNCSCYYISAHVLMFQRAYVTMSYVQTSQRNSRTIVFLCLVKLAYSVLFSPSILFHFLYHSSFYSFHFLFPNPCQFVTF